MADASDARNLDQRGKLIIGAGKARDRACANTDKKKRGKGGFPPLAAVCWAGGQPETSLQNQSRNDRKLNYDNIIPSSGHRNKLQREIFLRQLATSPRTISHKPKEPRAMVIFSRFLLGRLRPRLDARSRSEIARVVQDFVRMLLVPRGGKSRRARLEPHGASIRAKSA